MIMKPFRKPFAHGPKTRPGFSLLEVMVATTVMAMMVVSLMSYVQFASEAWRRGKLTLARDVSRHHRSPEP
jgi:prepilin-type N-terminal cleavage/methylation domain-containing protein